MRVRIGMISRGEVGLIVAGEVYHLESIIKYLHYSNNNGGNNYVNHSFMAKESI